MNEQILFFVRHAETELNRLGIIQGSGVDTSLNDHGLLQADRLYKKYADHNFDVVITSSLQRTFQTVKKFIDSGLPHIVDTRINEISWGHKEGKPSTPEDIEAYHSLIADWKAGNLDTALPGGESARSLFNRTQDFLNDIVRMPYRRPLICTHGRTLRCIVTCIEKEHAHYMEKVTHANTGVFAVRLNGHSNEWILKNDLAHLHD